VIKSLIFITLKLFNGGECVCVCVLWVVGGVLSFSKPLMLFLFQSYFEIIIIIILLLLSLVYCIKTFINKCLFQTGHFGAILVNCTVY